jgi:hypothetical protein
MDSGAVYKGLTIGCYHEKAKTGKWDKHPMGYTIVTRLMGLETPSADVLSNIRTGEIHPLGVTWLHEALGHVGAQTIAAMGPQLGVTTTSMKVCNACSKNAEEQHDAVSLGNVDRGRKPHRIGRLAILGLY